MATLAELFSTAYHSAKENALRRRAQEAQENYWQRLLQQQAEEIALGEKRLDHIIDSYNREFKYREDRDATLDEIREREFQAALDQWKQDYLLREKAAETQELLAGTQAGYLNLAQRKHEAEMDLIEQQKRLAELIGEIEFMGTQPPYPPMAPEPVTIGSFYRERIAEPFEEITGVPPWAASLGHVPIIGPAVIIGSRLNRKRKQMNAEEAEKYVVDMLNTVTAFEPKTPEELAALRNTRQYAVAHNTLLQIYDYINNNKYLSKQRVRDLKAMAQIKGRRLGFDLESAYNAALNAQQQPTE